MPYPVVWVQHQEPAPPALRAQLITIGPTVLVYTLVRVRHVVRVRSTRIAQAVVWVLHQGCVLTALTVPLDRIEVGVTTLHLECVCFVLGALLDSTGLIVHGHFQAPAQLAIRVPRTSIAPAVVVQELEKRLYMLVIALLVCQLQWISTGWAVVT